MAVLADTLIKATEALIEAALKESSAQLSAAAKDAVVELRHIHGATDKLGNVEENVVQKLEQVRESIVQAIAGQTRTLSLHAAIGRGDVGRFQYRLKDHYGGNTYSDVLVMEILKNALKGFGTCLPSDAIDGGTGTAEGFRDKIADHLHGMTGIKPTVELGKDGKSYVIRL